MVSTVRSRLNHYDTLGITPNATSDEIARAFARESSVLRPHVFGHVTEVCIAYETLRDPIKRRAYDEALGVRPALAPSNAQAVPPFLASGPGEPDELSAFGILPPPAPPEACRPKPEPFTPPAAKLPGDAPLPQPANPVVGRSSTEPGAEHDRRIGTVGKPEPRPSPRPPISAGHAIRFAPDEYPSAGVRPIEWKRTGIAVGALVGVACLLGALAGLWSGSEASEPAQRETVASATRPPATPTPAAAAPPAASAWRSADAQPERPRRPPVALARTRSTPVTSRAMVAAEQPLDSISSSGEVDQGPLGSSAGEQGTATEPAASADLASLPLSNRVIARTIQRIGYSCGRVASTTRVEEIPGAYKVTCTSGQSYQARPVNGRFHFRRWGTQ